MNHNIQSLFSTEGQKSKENQQWGPWVGKPHFDIRQTLFYPLPKWKNNSQNQQIQKKSFHKKQLKKKILECKDVLFIPSKLNFDYNFPPKNKLMNNKDFSESINTHNVRTSDLKNLELSFFKSEKNKNKLNLSLVERRKKENNRTNIKINKKIRRQFKLFHMMEQNPRLTKLNYILLPIQTRTNRQLINSNLLVMLKNISTIPH